MCLSVGEMAEDVASELSLVNGHKVLGRASDVGCVGSRLLGTKGGGGGNPLLRPNSSGRIHVCL